MTYTFCCKIQEIEGRYVLTFPDIGCGATDGVTVEEALLNAVDCLVAILESIISGDGVIPYPSFISEHPITVALDIDDIIRNH